MVLTNSEIAERLRKAIEQRGMSYRSLCRALDMPLTTFSRRLRGKVQIDVDFLARVAAQLGVYCYDIVPELQFVPPNAPDPYAARSVSVVDVLKVSLSSAVLPAELVAPLGH